MSSAEPVPVLVPLLNANEPDAVVASLAVAEGQEVEAGSVVCTLENTKATEEVVAEAGGFVVGLPAEGATVSAGDVLYHIAPAPDWAPPAPPEASQGASDGEELPEGLRITQPALALARQLSLDLARLPVGPLVSVDVVRATAGGPAVLVATQSEGPFDAGALVVYGGGGHGKTLIDLLAAGRSPSVKGIVDDRLVPGTEVRGVPVLGGSGVLADLPNRGIVLAANGVGGIARVGSRSEAFSRLADAGLACPTLVHPRAWVEPSAALAAAAQVLAHAYVGSDAHIGFGCILNTAAVVSHDCVLGRCVVISPGALLAGGVKVGAGSLLGMGVNVNIGVTIGEGCRVGNGAVVKSDVPDGTIVRAGTVWPT